MARAATRGRRHLPAKPHGWHAARLAIAIASLAIVPLLAAGPALAQGSQSGAAQDGATKSGWQVKVQGPAGPAARKPPVAAAAAPPPPAAIPPSGTAALDVALSGDAQRSVLSVTLTGAARFAVFTLADPYRVIIDLQDVDFQIPQKAGASGRGVIQSFRFGLLAPGKSRIVIDANGPVAIDKTDLVNLRGSDRTSLRVELVPTDRAGFLARIATPAAPVAPPVQTAPLVPAAAYPPIPPPSGQVRRPGAAKPVIVLDPGHGGIDAGTLGSSSLSEKNLVLAFGKLLRDKLKATGRFDVRMTRELDVFVPLDARVRFAREQGCQLFISLHTDSVPAQHSHLNVRGATVYTMTDKLNDARALQLAEKENLSDVIAGVEGKYEEQPEVASILTDLMRRESSNSALAFTNTLLPQMRRATGLSREPHRHAAFKVLRAPDIPSVLVELGFLSNKEDEKLLGSKEWQEQVAAAVTRAVETYFSKRVARRAPY